MTPEATRLRDRLAELASPDDPQAPVTLTVLDAPVGPLVAAAVDGGLVLLEFGAERRLAGQLRTLERLFGKGHVGEHPILDQTRRELAEYFDGSRQTFEVPLVIRGTPFQELVWEALLAIPFGETRAYADIADALGIRNGQRAVGLANGQNRLAIIVPCHRVIERGGGLRGYGGGLPNKKLLLDLERRSVDPLLGTPLFQAARSSSPGE